MQNVEGLNKLCGREECLVSDPFLCVGCLGNEDDDFPSDDELAGLEAAIKREG